MLRAGLGALTARGTGLLIATDAPWTDGAGEAHPSAVGAGVAAPEVLDHHAERRQHDDRDERCAANVLKEVQHFHVGQDAVGLHHKVSECGGRHAADDEDEEGKQKILDASQTDIEPAGQGQVASQKALADLPEIFRERSHRAEPTAEGALEQQATDGEDEEENHRRRMNGGNSAG